MYFPLIVAVVFALDRITKHLVMAEMELQQSIPIFPDVFHITYIHNYGAAFSLLEGRQMLLIVITAVVMLVLLFFLIRNLRDLSTCEIWALSLILGGGIGNLWDRVQLGYVPDFLNFCLIEFPVFNVADISVCCGCGLLFLSLLVLEPRSRRRQEYRR
ncbi:MAG: signal peptidase II [Bacillota bacterium]|nr:signal peptidase II [Bacillota bacterium]